jgi:hypothetical protein
MYLNVVPLENIEILFQGFGVTLPHFVLLEIKMDYFNMQTI